MAGIYIRPKISDRNWSIPAPGPAKYPIHSGLSTPNFYLIKNYIFANFSHKFDVFKVLTKFWVNFSVWHGKTAKNLKSFFGAKMFESRINIAFLLECRSGTERWRNLYPVNFSGSERNTYPIFPDFLERNSYPKFSEFPDACQFS